MISIRAMLRRAWRSIVDDQILRRILANSGWLLGANGVGIPLGLVQSVMVARLLGVEQYGILSIILSFVAVINRLTSFRMNELVVKYVSEALVKERPDLASATIKAALVAEAGASILAFVITLLLTPLAARWFVGDPAAQSLIYTYALIILGNAVIETATGVLQVFNRFKAQALINVFAKIVTVGGVGFVYVEQGGLWGVVVAYLVGTILSAFTLVVYTLREISHQLGPTWWRVPLGNLKGEFRTMSKFALANNAIELLGLVYKDSELIWLGWLRNPTEVGYYKLAQLLVKLIVIPSTPLVKAIYPEISQTIEAGKSARTKRLLAKGTFIACIWIVPVGLGFMLVSPWLIRFFYGLEFVPAVSAFLILLLGLGIVHLLFWARPAVLSLGRADVFLKVTLLQTILKIPMVLILVPTYGYIMMATIQAGLFVLGVSMTAIFVWVALGQLQPRRTPITTTTSS